VNTKNYFAFNFLDKFLLLFISAFFIFGFLLWLLSNIFGISDLFIWFAMLPLSVYLSYFILNKFSFQHVTLDRQTLLPYGLLLLFLLLSVAFMLQPIWSNPYATIGIPNKDLHDGITAFISTYGHPPPETISEQNAFIPNSQNGYYLGYPNALHTFAAFFNKFGGFAFHTTWFAVILGLITTSFAVFLLSKAMNNNNHYSAVIAGLFIVSSFRISYAAPTSIPMLFSYTLVLPCLLLCLFVIYNKSSKLAYVLSSIALALVAASYSGVIIFVFGLLLFYCFFLLLTRDTQRLKNILQLTLWSLPLLAITFLAQKGIYWQNTFPTARDYDPYELSQRVMPIDKPIYMLAYFFSLGVLFVMLIKNRLKQTNMVKIYLLLINLGFLSLIIYDLLFHRITGITTSDQLITADPNGFFGGLNHQKVSRLALLQPFFFILLVGEFSILIKNNLLKVSLLVITIALFFVIRIEIPKLQPLAPELASSFYNQKGSALPYTLLSDTRLIVNDQIWSKDIIDGLDVLSTQENIEQSILVWDDRNWTEETISGWGSVYLKQKLFKTQDLSLTNKIVSPGALVYLADNGIRYILLLYPTESNLNELKKSGLPMQILWEGDNSYVVKLED